jgi:hypothetical protein
MDTRFGPMELRGPWPGDQSFLWHLAVTEGRNRLACESHDTSCRTSSEFYWLSKQPTVSPIPDKMSAASVSLASGNWCLPALHEESDDRLSVFRVFEIPSLSPQVGSKPLAPVFQHLLHCTTSWPANCIAWVLYANRLRQDNHPGSSRARAAFVNGPTDFQVL